MEVITHDEVDNDLLDPIKYYVREAGSELGEDFYREFRRCLKMIAERANKYPLYTGRLRRLNFDRFPYHILFEVLDSETVFILAVKHDSQDPDLGLDR